MTLLKRLGAIQLNNAGYNLDDIKFKDGTFDLTPLIVGSQGTLGIITEITLDIEDYNPSSTLVMAEYDSLEKLQQSLLSISESKEPPTSIEMVDKTALDQLFQLNPNHLKDSIKTPLPTFVVFIEYEGHKKLGKSMVRNLEENARSFQVSTDPEEQIGLRSIREAVSVLTAHNEGLIRLTTTIRRRCTN